MGACIAASGVLTTRTRKKMTSWMAIGVLWAHGIGANSRRARVVAASRGSAADDAAAGANAVFGSYCWQGSILS